MRRSRVEAGLEQVLSGIFRSGDCAWNGISWGWVLGVFLLGLIAWGAFLSWGNLAFDVHDWVQEGPRYDFLRRSFVQGSLPLHMGTSLTETDRFLAIPDTVISPQVLLLRWVGPGPFVLFDALFLYSLGAVGFLLLSRKLRWSSFSTTAGWLLFALNGHITAQVAVGHSMWLSYFLLPFYLLLLLRLLDDAVGWRWILANALLYFAVLLNGGYHFFIWMAMFQLILAVFRPNLWRPVLLGLGSAGLLGTIRLLPAAVHYWGEPRAFIGGYPSLMHLFDAMTDLIYPGSIGPGGVLSIGWWELDAYVGLLGLIFLLVFGIVAILRMESSYRIFLPPAFVMMTLSIGLLYKPITMLPIPLVGAERVSSRFIILPLVILVMLACHGFEHWNKKNLRNLPSRLTLLGLWVLMMNDLLQHARLWRVENMTLLFDQTPVDIGTEIITRSDPSYELSLLIGVALTVLTFCVLLFLTWREGKRSQG